MNTTMVIFGLVIAFIGIYMLYSFRKIKNTPMVADNDKIKILTAQNFQNQIKTGVTLVDFWADWCMPCKMMAPILNSVAEELTDNATVAKLNVQLYESVSKKYGVMGIPTMILFKNGKEIDRFVGVKTKEFLLSQISKHV